MSIREKIDFTKLTPVLNLKSADSEDDAKFKEMFNQGYNFLMTYNWCTDVEEAYFGCGISDVVAIFLVKIKTLQTDVDEWLWVVAGDLPTAYISAFEHYRLADAAEAYVYQMRRWVNAVNSGESTSNLIPVNVPPTKEWGERLGKRLDMLETDIFPSLLTDFNRDQTDSMSDE